MRIYDITHYLEDATPVYPGDPPVRVEEIFTLEHDGFSVRRISMSTHAGTHMDAPAHFIQGGGAADAVDLEKLMGPVVVVEHFSAAIESGSDRVVAKEGHLSRAQAEALLKAGVRVIGTAKDSVEEDPTYAVHRLLLQAEVVLLENLKLDGVEPGRYHLIALPMKIKGADGAPVRAVLVDDSSWSG